MWSIDEALEVIPLIEGTRSVILCVDDDRYCRNLGRLPQGSAKRIDEERLAKTLTAEGEVYGEPAKQDDRNIRVARHLLLQIGRQVGEADRA